MSEVLSFLDPLFNMVMLPLSQYDLSLLVFSLPWLFLFFGMFFLLIRRIIWGLL